MLWRFLKRFITAHSSGRFEALGSATNQELWRIENAKSVRIDVNPFQTCISGKRPDWFWENSISTQFLHREIYFHHTFGCCKVQKKITFTYLQWLSKIYNTASYDA